VTGDGLLGCIGVTAGGDGTTGSMDGIGFAGKRGLEDCVVTGRGTGGGAGTTGAAVVSTGMGTNIEFGGRWLRVQATMVRDDTMALIMVR